MSPRSFARVTALTALLATSGCTTVRQLRLPEGVPTSGKAERTRSEDALDYSVATRIAAPPEVVWAILADGPAYPSWTTTIVKIEGELAAGQRIRLVARVAPERTFPLEVTTFDPPKKLVWEDGTSMFLGVRTFTLRPDEGGTLFTMSETFSGGMLGMIESSLPDFTEPFQTFAADLKQHAESTVALTAPKQP